MPLISEEQIRQAKSVDILAYLRTHEPQSIRRSKGSREEYYLADHDSLKISNGKFHWFSRGIGGRSALDFLVKVRCMDFTDAVLHLTDGRAAYKAEPPPRAERTPKPFTLPQKNVNNDRVYAYLRGRGIDAGIIKRCIDSGILYENTRHNCVFVGYDGDKPKFAFERSTSGGLKKDISGSNKRFSFVLPPSNPESRNLAVCESPVDILSHASIHKLDGDKWEGWRLSLGGLGSAALISFLERHPQIESVRLCLDNDTAGKNAANRIIRELLSDGRYSRLKLSNAPPPLSLGKDYSDALQAVIQFHKQQSRADRPKVAVSLR